MQHFFFANRSILKKDTFLNVLKYFKIDKNQIYTITSDNGVNMLKAINQIENYVLEFEKQVSENDVLEPDERVQ